MTKKYNKLVRDKIPDLIQAQGKTVKIKCMNKESLEYRKAIADKLVEEANEYRDAVYNGGNYLEEYADVRCIINEIMKIFSSDEIEEHMIIYNNKTHEKGEFKKGIFLIEVENES